VQSTATVSINVIEKVIVAGPLNAVDDAVTVATGSTITPIDVLANDSFGVNGPNASHPLTLTNGKIFHASNMGGDISVVNGKVNYTPKNGFSGIDTFDYTITDSKGFADQGIVTVTVGGLQSKTSSKVSSSDTSYGISGLTVSENTFLTYPNPSNGYIKTALYSSLFTKARIVIFSITGKVLYNSAIVINKGHNEFDFNFNIAPGIVFMKIVSSELNFGTTKIMMK